MANPEQLIVSETFYSIQGEGPSVGTPAVFLRLAGCNLNCPGFSYKDPNTGEHLGCDTAAVWRSGNKYTHQALIQYWAERDWLASLQDAHLVITGGEPLLHQAALIQFLNALEYELGNLPYVEVETNATQMIAPDLLEKLSQINASPKLTHSGEPKEKAYRLEVLKQLARTDKAFFKFVVHAQSDMDEIMQAYVFPLQLPTERVWLMPEGGTREALYAKAPMVVECCKRYGMHYSPRLQVDIWGEVTGV